MDRRSEDILEPLTQAIRPTLHRRTSMPRLRRHQRLPLFALLLLSLPLATPSRAGHGFFSLPSADAIIDTSAFGGCQEP